MLARRSYSPALLILLISLVVLLAAACAAAPAMPQPAGEDGSNGQGRPAPEAPSEDGATADLEDGVRDGALIVYTGRLRLEVAEIAPVIESATRLIVDLGGYVAGSEEFNTTSEQSASITFRVPSERWAEAVGGLRGLAGRVLNESTESAEVTAEVIDLEARIANLRASEAALQEIMTRAGTIEDVLQVQRELSNVRGQIEQLTASRDHLRDRAAYGTLTVSFESPVVAASLAQEGWQLSGEVDRALADLIRIGQALSSMVIWLAIVALPVLLPLALVVFIALRLRRRWAAGNRPADPLRPSV